MNYQKIGAFIEFIYNLMKFRILLFYFLPDIKTFL